MFITLSQHPSAPRAPQTVPHNAPFASFEALTRSLRRACAQRSGPAPALWRRSAEVAVLARRAGACDSLITAALLHRLGDLVLDACACDAAPLSAVEIAHLGAGLLVDLYPTLVTEPIRLQPSAQRYLATVTLPSLRGAARAELGYCGPNVAPMTEPERACFVRLPFAMNAVRLCRWTLAATGEAGVERELPALHRIAGRSVCNDGFGWGA
jgi:predicted HD phosphohydrolase